MRTTVDIDAVLLKDLKRLQRKEGKTLGALVSELLAAGLAARTGSAPQKRRKFKVRTFDLGLPLVDLDDKQALQALLDEEDQA